MGRGVSWGWGWGHDKAVSGETETVCTLYKNLKKEQGHTQLLDQHYLTLEEEVAVNLLPQVTTFFPSLSPFLFQLHICLLYTSDAADES